MSSPEVKRREMINPGIGVRNLEYRVQKVCQTLLVLLFTFHISYKRNIYRTRMILT